jgi:cytoskeleton protein RodZ
MPSIGETLRDARMRQRLDIADVEQRTKIRAKYLRALENEEFGMLPGPTFVKTFLRTYAEMLGLDPHVLVEAYRANYEREEELELQPLGPPSAIARDRSRRPRPGPGLVALLVLVAVVGALVAIGLIGDDDDGSGEAQNRTTPTERTETTAAKPRKEPARRKQVRVRIKTATPTYVCFDRGPGTDVVVEDTIDGFARFRGKRVRLLLGKRDVQVWMDKKPVRVTPGGDPIALAFTPRGMHELPDGTGPCI